MFPKVKKKWLKNKETFFLLSESIIKLENITKKGDWRNRIDYDSEDDNDDNLEAYSLQNNSPIAKKNNYILGEKNGEKMKNVIYLIFFKYFYKNYYF